jgi:hypothetical protein
MAGGTDKLEIIADSMHAARANLLKCRSMNILIEDAETLEYLTSNSLWTKNAATGKDFGATGAAFTVAKKELIGKFNIVGYNADTKQFINLNHGKGKGAEAGTV